jgi:hypothetical protein
MTDLKRALRIAGLKAEALALEAETLAMPADVPGWLDEAESRTLSLSDALPHNPALLAHIGIARACLRRGDDAGLRRSLLDICRNLKAAGHDEWVLGVQAQFGRAADVRAKAIRDEREPVWEQWRKEAERIKKAYPGVRWSKNSLAEQVKKNLKPKDAISTIRKRI